MKYRMPAEWEPHEGTWIAWPHNKEHWPGKFKPIPFTYIEIVRALSSSEKVFICVNDQKMENEARHFLAQGKMDLTNVFFFHISTDASWSRDHGPIFVYNEEGERTILDWQYNANGNKWGPYNKDDAVPVEVGRIFHVPVVEPHMILEGGSIEVNGRGTLLTTSSCLFNKNRNPQLSHSEIEKFLKKYLGVNNILWLKEGILGDDTDGHIDDIARFVDERTIVAAVENNHEDENYNTLRKNYQDLQKMKNERGEPFKIIAIPMPQAIYYESQRLPASYANFYIGNIVVLVPTFQCKRDEEVLNIFKKLFPERKIIGVDCVDLVWGLGTIHCSTQQQPK